MKTYSILALAMVSLSLLVGAATGGTYSGGSGEPNNPYQISSVADWQELMATPTDWGRHFTLTSDIDLNDDPLNPIGNYSNNFTGVFDGNDYVICYARVDMPSGDYVGLFGYLGTNGQIKNLGVENTLVFGRNYVGGLVGYNSGTISNCYYTGDVSGNSYVGGLVGLNYRTISNCYSTGPVNGSSYIGGLVGWNGSSTISNCYSTASVSGTGDYVGGLVGNNYYYGHISDCYSTGSVSGTGGVGGLVGRNYGGTITNCYSSGSVSGNYSVGGLVGENSGAISNCYSTGSVNGTGYYVGGLVGLNDNGSISNCYSTGSVTGSRVGGLVGENYGTISNCYSNGSVTGTGFVGGLVGENYSTISNCYSTGSVTGTGSYVGGLVGWNGDGAISNCNSTGSVTGGSNVGGLVGTNDYGTITNCYSTGTVSGTSSVGGLVGRNGFYHVVYHPGWIYKCYSTGEVMGSSNVGGLVGTHIAGEVGDSFWDIETSDCNTSAGGTGKTTTQMMTLLTFTSAGWDFTNETDNGTNDCWRMCVDDVNYPLLSWQFALKGDFTCPDGVDILDLAFLVDRWLAECDETNNFCNCTDTNYDQQVDFRDFAILASHWLEGN
jgi:hypothetical protein